MKITDYEKVRQLDESNIVLIDGNNGTIITWECGTRCVSEMP